MKITNTSIETLSHGSATTVGGTSGAGGVESGPSRAAAAKSANADSVDLSAASKLVNLAKAAASSPERASKLANVAALVRSGQYKTDTASVSRAVVEGHIQ